MSLPSQNYWRNFFKLLRGDRLLHPLAISYCVTAHCNLNCIYCQEFGARRNARAESPLSLDAALRVLQIIREGSDNLIFTGGEPLLHPDIVPLVTHARRELEFHQITLLTNGLLLPQAEALLPALDRLVISLDATDPDFWSQTINAPASTAQRILDNVKTYARRRRRDGNSYQLILNCVLTPQTLPGARRVLDFCVEQGLFISFSPQAVQNWPHYDLLISDDYRDFLTKLMTLKKQGAPLLSSLAYLRTLRDMAPYACYPTLIPRVMPNGDLVYPCWPIEKEKNAHGGRPCNLLETFSWTEALETAIERYDRPPRVCTSCFQQCYAEPSLMQGRPLSLLWELIRYSPSRRGALWTHAPG